MLPQSEQLLILNQMFFDLENKKLTDPKIVNVQQNKIMPDGISEAARKYSMLMNEELDNVFKEQISNKEMIKGKIATVLGFAGLTAKIIGTQLLKSGLLWIFITISTAIAVFIGIVSLSCIIGVVIVGIVIYLAKLLIKYLGKKLKENPQIKYEFMEGVIKLINRFKKTPVESLNYENILDDYQQMKYQELSNLGKTKNSKYKVKLEYFREMFIKIVDIDSAYDDFGVFEVYNELM
jgi:uncharacterized protein YneF (UPF0154 family)